MFEIAWPLDFTIADAISVVFVVVVVVYLEESVVVDISVDAKIEIDPMKLSEQEISGLRLSTKRLYHNFTPSNSQFIVEKSSSKSLDLQCLFYSKLVDNETEGMQLHLADHGVSELLNRASRNWGDRETAASSGNVDNVSISLSVTSEPEEIALEQEVIIPFRQMDTVSLSSSVSGNVIEPISHSIPGANLSDSNADIEPYEDDDPDGIYEDIEDICENLEKEVAAAAADTSTKDTTKKSSILSFLKSVKKKGKKNKEEKVVSATEAAVDLEFHEEDESSMKADVPVPDVIPPTEDSASESYDEMGPNNDGYLSDNYEDVGFQEEEGGSSKAPPLPPPLMEEPPAQVKQKIKGKMLLRSAIEKKEPPPSATPALPGGSYSKTDDLAFQAQAVEKKKKLKEELNLKAFSTLPRKASKLAGAGMISQLQGPSKQTDAIVEASGEVISSDLREQVSELRNEVETLKAKLSNLSSAVESLTAQCAEQHHRPQEIGSMPRATDGQESEELGCEMNLKILKQMSVDQVNADDRFFLQ